MEVIKKKKSSISPECPLKCKHGERIWNRLQKCFIREAARGSADPKLIFKPGAQHVNKPGSRLLGGNRRLFTGGSAAWCRGLSRTPAKRRLGLLPSRPPVSGGPWILVPTATRGRRRVTVPTDKTGSLPGSLPTKRGRQSWKNGVSCPYLLRTLCPG